MSCWYCDGSGRVEEANSPQQTLWCPICRAVEAEQQSVARLELPSWHLSYWPQLEAKFHGPRFQVEPWLLVIHSGATAPGVAEFFHRTGFVVANDGRKIKVSAHINWSSEHNGFVQSVPLSHVAWHCGGSRLRGDRKLNFCSIGIELPGPWNKARPDRELGILRDSVAKLIELIPTLKHAVRHSDIDPGKKDPGPGFTWDCLDGLGLEI